MRWLGIIVAVALPSVVTWCYFILLADQPAKLQQGTYSVGKVFQFSFPLLWLALALKRPWFGGGLSELPATAEDSTWRFGTSIGFATAMGLAVCGAMFAIYCWGLPDQVRQDLNQQLTERVQSFSINSAPKFLGLSVFYALVHSFLEEYYYRWFVFGQLRNVTGLVPAMIWSGLAFMGHHVIVLAHYFGGLTPVAIFLSLSIAVGGMIWAWQYEKSRSLLGPWLSHLLVDAGIFGLGFWILRQAGAV